MACEKWTASCQKLHDYIGDKFFKWGVLVYNRANLVILISSILSLILSSGFLKFNTYGQAERLFYPQNSQLFKDLDRSEKNFNYYVQNEEFLIRQINRSSIFTMNLFREALQIHKDLMNIPGFDKFCVSRKGKCMIVSPLEFFDYNENLFENIEKKLIEVYINSSYVMENGHTAPINFPLIFGNFHINITHHTLKASILRISYPVKFAKTRNIYTRNGKWERKMLVYMRKIKPILAKKGLELLYNTVISRDDSIEQNTKDNLLLISASVFFMVLFCAVAMTKLGSRVQGHFLLSLFGICCIMLGIGAGFGLALFTGQPYVGFVGVLPFLVLGIGIDDMFIIVNKVDHTEKHIKGAARLGEAMRKVGLSVTMTTVTDLVAFIIGTVSLFPAVRIFCVYAFLSLFFAYCMIMTLFLAMLSYDMKRVKNNKLDCIPCIVGNKRDQVYSEELINPILYKSFTEKMIEKYGEILMKPVTKVIVVLFAVLLVAAGSYGTSQTSVSFDYKIVGSDETEHVKWIVTMEKLFPIGKFPIDIVIDDETINYTDVSTQRQFTKLDEIIRANKHFSNVTRNWYTSFLKWKSVNSVTADFYGALHIFLMLYKDFKNDIVFDNKGKIKASRIHVYTTYSLKWNFRKDAMSSLRKDLKHKIQLDFFPVTFKYIYASQLSVIIESTLINIGICCAVILLITLPYVINPVTSLLLLFSFLCFIIELLGVMFFWGLSLDSITMIVMVMAIGFTMDYSCHITHGFLISTKITPEKRIVDAMGFMGLNVLKGGLSTLVGVMVLALSSSKLFNLFFKMMFTIITLGLIHGMVILPVLLTLFCRKKLINVEEKSVAINGSRKNHDTSDPKVTLVDTMTTM